MGSVMKRVKLAGELIPKLWKIVSTHLSSYTTTAAGEVGALRTLQWWVVVVLLGSMVRANGNCRSEN